MLISTSSSGSLNTFPEHTKQQTLLRYSFRHIYLLSGQMGSDLMPASSEYLLQQKVTPLKSLLPHLQSVEQSWVMYWGGEAGEQPAQLMTEM